MRDLREKMGILEEQRRRGNTRNTQVEIKVVRRQEPKEGRRLLRSREVNREVLQDRDSPMVIVGSDVEALYPSLEDVKVAEICYKAVLESDMKFENIDYKEAVRYIAMHWSESQCRMSDLRRVLPTRTSVKGVRPGVTGEGPLGPGDEEKEETQWRFPRVCLTEVERRKVIATVVQIGVIVMFNTHIYQFGGQYYLQKRGGPIGLRATCAVARLCMLDWDVKWLAKMKENMVELEDAGRYMDDLRAFLHSIRKGWRWYEGELCWSGSGRRRM